MRITIRTIVLITELFILFFSVHWSVNHKGLLDFGSFIASGQAANKGLNPYGVYENTFRVIFNELGLDVQSPNLNPPVTVYLFQGIAEYDPYISRVVWYLASAIMFFAAISLLALTYRQLLSPLKFITVVSLAGLWHTLALGQIYAPLALAIAGSWLLLVKGSSVLPGLLLGAVVSIKPTLAIWPCLMLAAGHRNVSVSALLTSAAISAIPFLITGPGIYGAWIEATRAYTGLMIPGNGSLPAFTARAGVPWAGVIASGVLVALLMAWAIRRRPSAQSCWRLGLLAALLIGPISWGGYMTFLFPILLERRWTLLVVVCAALLIVPVWLMIPLAALSPAHNIVLGSLNMFAMLLLFAQLVREDVLRSSQSSAAFRSDESPSVRKHPLDETLKGPDPSTSVYKSDA